MKAQNSHLSPIFALALLVFSCNEQNTAKLAPEYLFNSEGQKVIKSIINNKMETIAVLYGNEPALQAAHDSLAKPRFGSRYTLVTWKQKPMPGWYGTNMNGPIYSVETVHTSQRNGAAWTFTYNFQPGQGYQTGDMRPEPHAQIRFITSQHAATFP